MSNAPVMEKTMDFKGSKQGKSLTKTQETYINVRVHL